MKKGSFLAFILFGAKLTTCDALHTLENHKVPSSLRQFPGWSRRKLFSTAITLSIVTVGLFPIESTATSYSSNARNFERMNSGDMSGGSIYDNNPKSDTGKRRRAMTGCKSTIAREEAADFILKVGDLSEKDCNKMVLDGNPEFMLQALRNLDCPSCPYGIKSTR